MASSKCLIIITLAAIFQIVQCKVDPTIGFISPDIVADIGESLYLKYKVLYFDLEICNFLLRKWFFVEELHFYVVFIQMKFF